MRALRINAYLGLVITAGAASVLFHALLHWSIGDWTRYFVYCAIALVASRMKVTLPRVTGTMSLNFLFVLIGISEFGLPGTLVMGCLGMLVQCLFQTRSRPKPVQVTFSIASVACSIEACSAVFRLAGIHAWLELPLRLLLAAGAYFAANTLSIAAAIALTESKPIGSFWRDTYFWTFPNYLVGAAVAWFIDVMSRVLGWQASLLMLPVLYLAYRSFSLYITHLENEKKQAEAERAHAEEVAALHRRAIETLALAIEAKDQTTHDHLERVEIYAVEVAKELGMSDVEIEALRAAALLHDVGKVAVPEHIISKPGKLTPGEFERMKTHTVVGAEIAERIRFPYPVAPLVRGHHEKWNGSGYPDGLAGEEIPLGARILAAVDCLDALASDRQYRRALPLSEAIKIVVSEAGKSFDPRVVGILERRYLDLDRLVKASASPHKAKLSTELKIVRGEAPAAGFESVPAQNGRELLSLNSSLQDHTPLSAAQIIEQWEGSALLCTSLNEFLSGIEAPLFRLIPHHAMAVYVHQNGFLVPVAWSGPDYRPFLTVEIPIGEGLSGWVAENGKPILNGNPSVEPGYLKDPAKFSVLQSALSVPFEAEGRNIGVLSVYHEQPDAFSPAHLESLTCFGGKLAQLFERLATAAPR